MKILGLNGSNTNTNTTTAAEVTVTNTPVDMSIFRKAAATPLASLEDGKYTVTITEKKTFETQYGKKYSYYFKIDGVRHAIHEYNKGKLVQELNLALGKKISNLQDAVGETVDVYLGTTNKGNKKFYLSYKPTPGVYTAQFHSIRVSEKTQSFTLAFKVDGELFVDYVQLTDANLDIHISKLNMLTAQFTNDRLADVEELNQFEGQEFTVSYEMNEAGFINYNFLQPLSVVAEAEDDADVTNY